MIKTYRLAIIAILSGLLLMGATSAFLVLNPISTVPAASGSGYAFEAAAHIAAPGSDLAISSSHTGFDSSPSVSNGDSMTPASDDPARTTPASQMSADAGLAQAPSGAVSQNFDAGSTVSPSFAHVTQSNFSSSTQWGKSPSVFRVKPAQVIKAPLATQTVDLSSVSLTNGQVAALDSIAQEFTNSVAGVSQNPADPAYLAQWQTAQPDSDSGMREMMGDAAYWQYVGAAAVQKLNAKQ